MAEYLSMMKQITSKNMQLAGSTISQDDLIISYVLAGLDAEYILIVCDIEEEFDNPRANNSRVNNNTTTFIATPEILTNPNLLADSGAANHITNDYGNLQFKTKYYGTGSLTVGDGTK
ncbi:hypothetical protein Csa_011191 [Cucumis sativus]|nr:hypothetical protein Csa_011191 [Cucumis sativus]